MAAEGMKFTSFYSAQAVCSASRAALMTGCYSNRVGIPGALGPHSRIGISDKEMTIAQLCKQKNYATAIFGKWHLGDCAAVPAHPARLRRILRPALLQRHVAAPSRTEVAAAAAHRAGTGDQH